MIKSIRNAFLIIALVFWFGWPIACTVTVDGKRHYIRLQHAWWEGK